MSLEDLRVIKEEYNELVNKRMKGLVEWDVFEVEENRLNSEGIRIRKELNMLAKGEVMMCDECMNLISMGSEKDHVMRSSYNSCVEHALGSVIRKVGKVIV